MRNNSKLTAATTQTVRWPSSTLVVMWSGVETSLISTAIDFLATLAFDRNDSRGNRAHCASLAPKNRAHRSAIAMGDFQRQCGQLINPRSDIAQIERFNDCDAGASQRVMVLQRFRIDFIHRRQIQPEQFDAILLQPPWHIRSDYGY